MSVLHRHIQYTDMYSHLSEVCLYVVFKYLFEQQYNIVCESIFVDNFVVLSHNKGDIREVNRCSVEHPDILAVQLLHS